MKTINLILGAALTIAAIIATCYGKLELSLLFAILGKLYTDGSTTWK